jgi:hypothetical protein
LAGTGCGVSFRILSRLTGIAASHQLREHAEAGQRTLTARRPCVRLLRMRRLDREPPPPARSRCFSGMRQWRLRARRVVPAPRSSVGRFSKQTLITTLCNGRDRRKRSSAAHPIPIVGCGFLIDRNCESAIGSWGAGNGLRFPPASFLLVAVNITSKGVGRRPGALKECFKLEECFSGLREPS